MFQQKMQEEEENRFCIYRNKTFNRRISMKEKGISRRQEEIFMTEMVWF